MEGKYDQAFLGMLHNEGRIERFLDEVMGFLYRRTDFYRILRGKEDKLGFPPGVAQQMLAESFKRYEELAAQDEKMQTTKEDCKKPKDKDKLPRAAASSQPIADKTTCTDTAPSVPSASKVVQQPVAVTKRADDKSKGDGTENTKDPNTGEEDDNPELTKQQQEFQSQADSYNGAVRDNYSWSQTITDLDLRVKVPENIRKGRDVQVVIDKRHVCVKYRGTEGNPPGASGSCDWVEVINGELTWEIHKEESIWSLVPGDHVHINFEKKEERWWEAVLKDEPKISVRKIDASRPMTDLDQEAQAKIEEMMYNDRQKKMGKPQSHEQKVHDMLRNAWDAEGSPFKGQEFDPTKLKVDQNGVVSMNPS